MTTAESKFPEPFQRLDAADKVANLMGCKSPAVNYPIQTASISDVREGNGHARCSEVKVTAALKAKAPAVGTTRVASKLGGLNIKK